MRLSPARAESLLFELGGPRAREPMRIDRAWWVYAAVIAAAGPLYGTLMGSFAFRSADRLLMVLFAAVKMPLLIFATTAVCLPAFFVLNTVLGLRADLA